MIWIIVYYVHVAKIITAYIADHDYGSEQWGSIICKLLLDKLSCSSNHISSHTKHFSVTMIGSDRYLCINAEGCYGVVYGV